MKAIYCLLFSLLCCCKLQAQNITHAEYFFDADPGVGKAITLTVTTASSISISNASIPTTGLATGFHNLAMRMQDAAGVWSQTEIRPLYITEIPVVLSSQQAAEYFFDTDPGVGKATNIAIPFGNSINASLFIPVFSLPVGFHNLVVRVKNNQGVWSHRETRPFFIVADDFITRNIVAAEYFVDTDPGFGNAAPIEVSAPTANFNRELQLPFPNNINEGTHFFFARVKDNLDRWSLLSLDTFYIGNALPVTGLVLTGTKTPNGHFLRWTTLSELNTHYFEIEHSSNGIHFTKIAAAAAAGNSNNLLRYSFTVQPIAAGAQFYRIAQIDKDAKVAYSNIIFMENSAGKPLFAVYPNPAKGLIEMRFDGKEKMVLANIIDMQGRSILRSTITNAPVLQMNLSGLSAGIYFIQLTDGITTQTGRFVKE